MFVFAFMLNLKLPHVLLIFGFMPIQQTALLTLFGLGFFWSVVPLDRRGGGGGVKRPPPFLKNYKRGRHETYITN